MKKSKQLTKHEIEIERRKQFVAAKLRELMPNQRGAKTRLVEESGVAWITIDRTLSGKHQITTQVLKKLAGALGVSVNVFDPDPKGKFRKELIESVIYGDGLRGTHDKYGVPVSTLQEMIRSGTEARDSIRNKVKKLLAKNPLYGPASVSRDLGIDPRYINKHCNDMFAPKAKRIPLPMRFAASRLDFTRIEGNNSYKILLLLVDGIAEMDIANQMGCSSQLVYYVRDQAIDAGFKFF